MTSLAFTNLLAVCAIAFLAPLAAAALGRLQIPAVVLELVAGIVVGPAVLGWVEVDDPVAVLALLGLATLLFLAGLEFDARSLRGQLARRAGVAFVASLGAALLAGLALQAAGLTSSPVFIAIVLGATSLGVVVPVLKDAGLEHAPVGQLVVLGASIADIATVILLSLLFSEQSASIGGQAILIGGLAGLAVAVILVARGAGRSQWIADTVTRLQDTTAQIRVRGAVLILVALTAAAQALGLEVILGAFLAGAALAVLDPDGTMVHPGLRRKLDAIGYGLLIPVFFVASGLQFDLAALTADASALLRVPIFLAALLIARALPAVLYRPVLPSGRHVLASGLLQATSLPFLVAASMIGVELGLLDAATAAGLIAAGLISVLLFPPLALGLLAPRGEQELRGNAPGARMRARHGEPGQLDVGPPAGGRTAAPAAGTVARR